MDHIARRIAMRVAAEHAAKQAVELVGNVATVAEHLTAECRARHDVYATCVRGCITAIRRELDDLEGFLAEPVEEAVIQAEAA